MLCPMTARMATSKAATETTAVPKKTTAMLVLPTLAKAMMTTMTATMLRPVRLDPPDPQNGLHTHCMTHCTHHMHSSRSSHEPQSPACL